MPAFTEYFCCFCNASAQRRDPGDEVHTGYVRKQADGELPRGWFEIQGGEVACNKCPQGKTFIAREELAERHPTLSAIADLAGSAPGTEVRSDGVTAINTEAGGEARWPSITSPFGQPSRAASVDTPADQDI
jgi:hypothetical protein